MKRIEDASAGFGVTSAKVRVSNSSHGTSSPEGPRLAEEVAVLKMDDEHGHVLKRATGSWF